MPEPEEVAVAEQTGKPAKPQEQPTPPVDPKEALEKAQDELAKAQFNVAEKNKKDKLEAELPKLKEAYAKEVDALKKSEDVLQKYSEAERKGLEEVLKPAGLAAYRAAKDKFEKGLAASKKAFEDAENDVTTSKDAAEKAAKARDDAKGTYESRKKGAAAVKERQRRLEGLRTEIDKAESSGNFAVAYWLLEDKYAKELGSEPQPQTPDEYKAGVDAAWTTLTKAEGDVREKDLALKKAISKRDSRKAEFESREKSRDADLRAELEKIAVPSTGNAPATSDEEGQ